MLDTQEILDEIRKKYWFHKKNELIFTSEQETVSFAKMMAMSELWDILVALDSTIGEIQ